MKSPEINQPVGIALGGGSAKGLAHIGVLKGLEAAGIKIGYIAGTSMGALIGAAYAAGISVAELEQIIDELNTRKLFQLFKPTISRYSLISDSAIMDFLDSLYGDVNIEDLHIPFRAVAVDFATGKRVVFSRGKLIDAVRASISIPMVFRQVTNGGRTLVDGGLVDPVPVGTVKEMGASYVIAVPVMTSRLNEREKPQQTDVKHSSVKSGINQYLKITPFTDRFSQFLEKHKRLENTLKTGNHNESEANQLNFFNSLMQSISVSGCEITRLQLELNPPDLIIRPEVGWLKMWDFHKASEAIRVGEEATKIALQQLQQTKQEKRIC